MQLSPLDAFFRFFYDRQVHIDSLHLQQFRNYTDLVLPFGKGVHLLIGQNGAGKTNILESVSVLSFTKSFLAQDEDDVRQWGTEYYRVSATVRSDTGEETVLEVVNQTSPRRQKACFRNDVRSPISAMVGQLPVVFFLPQDLGLFTGAPAERRRYIDQILSQVSPEYFVTLIEYQKMLKQRNALLRNIKEGSASVADLSPWDNGLAEKGSYVTLARLELMETFGLTLGEEVRALGELWSEVGMLYDRSTVSRDRQSLYAELLGKLQNNVERDVILQSTMSGPHRDDWHMRADGRAIESFASRGQQRVAMLALLFLEASYLELRRNEKPVILLDDIFSELDAAHRERVTEAFRDHQVLMTATEIPSGSVQGNVWKVEKGRVEVMDAVQK